MYKYLLKPIAFAIDPEEAHYKVVSLFKIALSLPFGKHFIRSQYDFSHSNLERTVAGLKFKNPIGLAAGFDKDGKFYKEMAHLGFGFIEIGTVTPKPQKGNPKPRLFRLPKDEALINRMGFNNDGVDAMVERLKQGKPQNVILGGNIGKNKTTPNENAIHDYVVCFEKLFNYVDYFVVNVSSPNTPGLRDLQDKKPLTRILSKLMTINTANENPKPIFLKIAPDLSDEQLDDIIEIVNDTKIAGVIATNTTIDRSQLKTNSIQVNKLGNGGLSGKPLQERSTAVIHYLKKKSNNAFPVIGVGGINGINSAKEKLDAGADLIQLYSGFVYEGPGLVKKINRGLVNF